uniref:Uncharacterized protein n=1 Tax=Tolypothrix bouteillei VB521301 TaxID=1479485 RepID=A0A0C1N2N9_9CYAN
MHLFSIIGNEGQGGQGGQGSHDKLSLISKLPIANPQYFFPYDWTNGKISGGIYKEQKNISQKLISFAIIVQVLIEVSKNQPSQQNLDSSGGVAEW